MNRMNLNLSASSKVEYALIDDDDGGKKEKAVVVVVDDLVDNVSLELRVASW